VVEVVGTISLTAAATAEVVIALTVAENRETIVIPSSVTVPAGEMSAKFPVGMGRQPPAATVQIAITASVAGAELTATLTIARP
jgi:hypothetical protein